MVIANDIYVLLIGLIAIPDLITTQMNWIAMPYEVIAEFPVKVRINTIRFATIELRQTACDATKKIVMN